MYETLCKPIKQYTLEGEFVKDWPSLRAAVRATGFSMGAIRNCCDGITSNCGGYIWQLAENPIHLDTLIKMNKAELERNKVIPDEIWRDIPNYEGLYQASSLGRIRSYDRRIIRKDGVVSLVRGKLIKTRIFGEGYYHVCLSKNGKVNLHTVHRLVAIAFIPNPDNLPQVNHKDESRTNNCVENLEWCTQKYNLSYGTVRERIGAKLLNRPRLSKAVAQYTKDGNIVAEYPSIEEAYRQTSISRSTIKKVIKGLPRWKTAGGFVWRLIEKVNETDNSD